ncbi:MAG: hypothetical protein ACTSR0_02750 [Candidatus Asgardarchaeia archaeon]
MSDIRGGKLNRSIDDIIDDLRMLCEKDPALGLRSLRELGDRLFKESDYINASRVYLEYATALSEIKSIVGFESYLVDVASKFERKKLWNEAANIYLITANYLFERGIIEQSAWLYEKAAEMFERESISENKDVIEACLLRSVECYDIIGSSFKAENLLFKAILVGSSSDPYSAEENAMEALHSGDFISSAATFSAIARIYEGCLNHMRKIMQNVEINVLSVYIKTLFLHLIADAYLRSSCVYHAAGMHEKCIQKLLIAKDRFETSAYLLKALIDSNMVSKSSMRRCSYDALMAVLLYKVCGNPQDAKIFFESFENIVEKRIKEDPLYESPYYRTIVGVLYQNSPRKIIKLLSKVDLGKIERIRDFFIRLIVAGLNKEIKYPL